jgi:hypothetical protein
MMMYRLDGRPIQPRIECGFKRIVRACGRSANGTGAGDQGGVRRIASRRPQTRSASDAWRRAAALGPLLALAAPALAASGPGGESVALRALSVVELQAFRRTSSIAIEDGAGRRGRATLIDLDPHVHAWYLLTLAWEGAAAETLHLENADPAHRRVSLDAAQPLGVVLESTRGSREDCALWSASAPDGLAAAKRSPAPYAPLCDGRLFLRAPVEGRRTTREWVADLLRDHVWGGERITDVVRDTLFRDAWLETPRLFHDGEPEALLREAPPLPRIQPPYGAESVDAHELGLDVAREVGGKLGIGHWVAVRDVPGVFVSAVTPAAIAPETLRGTTYPVNALDAVEAHALAYLVAFDLADFDLGFSLGTEHPRVGWADRVPADARDDSLPGPDGIGTIAPLVRTGMLSPALQGRVAATFTGGFKRQHGAFHAGSLAHVHHGSHYGFVENGVVLSRLQPGLATAVVSVDGRVDLETWSERDDAQLARVRFARQNGVALIERDASGGRSGPGALVTQWGPGNWSASEDRKLRTLRAGLCLLEGGDRRFLVYGYVSTATPSAMATVFQGYGCAYAMHLDMNALEHTYLAVYRRKGSTLLVEHLIEGMSVLDEATRDQHLPRFVGFPDNRDFFYLLRREAQ